jgi:hypothetical protein
MQILAPQAQDYYRNHDVAGPSADRITGNKLNLTFVDQTKLIIKFFELNEILFSQLSYREIFLTRNIF